MRNAKPIFLGLMVLAMLTAVATLPITEWLPVTTLYVYFGSVAANLAELTSGEIQRGPAGSVLLGIELVATLNLTLIITRKATRTLAQHLNSEASMKDAAS
jgi:hypothetical protein